MTRRARTGRPAVGDPYGTGLLGTVLAPALAVVGLLVVAIVTLNLFNGELPFGIGGGPTGNGNGANGPDRTAAPSNVVIPEDEADFLGSILYVKAGNVWIQDAENGPRQLSRSGHDSMASFSPDGAWVYYIQTEERRGYWPVRGRPGWWDMEVPHLKRIRADGSMDRPEELATGRFREGRFDWFSWMRQPVLSPNGTTVAMVTDQPDPNDRSVVLQLYDLEDEDFTVPDVPVTDPLGHQDPEWRADGRMLLYVRNGRDGTQGAPVIWRYDTREREAAAITTPGYLEPSYSPDGRYIAATRTSPLGTDVVILHGTRGTELLRVTNDGKSWGPVWSPAGDAVAFLRMDGQSVDLYLARLTGPAGSWTVEETIALTDVSGLDAASTPDWFIPPEELPAPTAPPSAPPTTAPNPSASASSGP